MSKYTKDISVIIATLGRPTLPRLIDSLHMQTLDRSQWEILTWYKAGEMNEYEARNIAATQAKGWILCFLDDDTYVEPDYLEKGLKHFEEYKPLDSIPIAVMDTKWEVQNQLQDHELWGTGCAMWSSHKAFDELGGFEVNWGLPGKVSGWRSDTDLLWRAVDKWGMDCYYHARDMLVHHPEAMKSPWNAKVERQFYLRHSDRCISLFLPVDLRMPSIMLALETGDDLNAQERRNMAKRQQNEFIKAGYLTQEQADFFVEEMKKVLA